MLLERTGGESRGGMVQLETAAFVHPTGTAAAAPPVAFRGAVTLHQFPMITFEVRIASRSIRVKKWRAGNKKQKTESAHI